MNRREWINSKRGTLAHWPTQRKWSGGFVALCGLYIEEGIGEAKPKCPECEKARREKLLELGVEVEP